MDRLSVLTFTCNDQKLAKELIKDVAEIADEIVIMDSSDVKIDKKYFPYKEKIKIFHNKRLGYPEPFKLYGISKCMGNWILVIYTDERLSSGLKRDIKKIMKSRKDTLVISIKRYDDWTSKGLGSHYSWQNVLFQNRLDKLNGVKGNIHEIAEPKDKNNSVKILSNKDYYIIHLRKEEELHLNYSELNQLLRISYGDMPRKFRNSGVFFGNPVALGLLDIYLKGKNPNDELSYVGYWIYFLLFHIKQAIDAKNIDRITRNFPQRMEEIRRYLSESNSKIMFKAIKEAEDIGVAYYLKLNTKKGMQKLSSYKENGIKLLFKLILDEYARKHRIRKVD